MSGQRGCNAWSRASTYAPCCPGCGGQPLAFEEGDICQRRRTADRIAAKRGQVIARLERRRDLVAGGERAERESVGNALGRHQNIRLDPVMLEGEHRARAPEAGLHLVGNKQDAVLVQYLFHGAEIVVGRDDNPPSPRIGSARKAATSPAVWKRSTSSSARATLFPACLAAGGVAAEGVGHRGKGHTGGIGTAPPLCGPRCR